MAAVCGTPPGLICEGGPWTSGGPLLGVLWRFWVASWPTAELPASHNYVAHLDTCLESVWVQSLASGMRGSGGGTARAVHLGGAPMGKLACLNHQPPKRMCLVYSDACPRSCGLACPAAYGRAGAQSRWNIRARAYVPPPCTLWHCKLEQSRYRLLCRACTLTSFCILTCSIVTIKRTEELVCGSLVWLKRAGPGPAQSELLLFAQFSQQ